MYIALIVDGKCNEKKKLFTKNELFARIFVDWNVIPKNHVNTQLKIPQELPSTLIDIDNITVHCFDTLPSCHEISST